MAGLRGCGRGAQTAAPGRFADQHELRRWLAAAAARKEWGQWRWQMRHALDAVDLARLGFLQQGDAAVAALRYPALVTPYYLALGRFDDPQDPMRRQWLPAGEECLPADGDSADPFGETASTSLPGVVHRFSDRLLVMTSARCAVRCRHCTRKNALDWMRLSTGARDLAAVREYVRRHPAIREVILSGGDPLLDGDRAVLRLVRAFASLPQVEAVRIGTRVPATLPMRITDGLAAALGQFGKVWVNTQFNHAAEMSPEAAGACARLVQAGIPVSNQTVLLRGVNDTLGALEALCRALQRARVRPYYVFVGDPVSGTAHLRVAAAAAADLAAALARRIGGLAMPRFVADIPGAPCKVDVRELVTA